MARLTTEHARATSLQQLLITLVQTSPRMAVAITSSSFKACTLENAKRHPISSEFVEDEGDVPVESVALQADRAAGDSDHSENEEFSEKEGNKEEGESDDDDCSTDQEEGPAFEPEEDMIVEE